MQHIHLKECNSTQLYLKNHYENLHEQDPFILASTDKQLNGIGRLGHTWDDYPNALALSFIIKPDISPIQIPLAAGIILCNYIKEKWNVDTKLKWPNDIINCDGQKCGGILCQYINDEAIICGIGINLGKAKHRFEDQNYKMNPGVISDKIILNPDDRKDISKNFYDYFFTYDLPELNIKKRFEKLCYHLNDRVSVSDNGNKWIGTFKGVSENGEAIVINDNNETKCIISGSLEILVSLGD